MTQPIRERIIDDLIYAESARGEAVFSLDRKFRFLLRRWITPREEVDRRGEDRVITFVMLNPSTADAFGNDKTIDRCIAFTQRLGADTLEAVNLFPLTATDPAELRKAGSAQYAGDGATNDRFIRATVARALMTVAAWGNHGRLYDRAELALREGGALHSVELHHLGLTENGYPKHPSARGKHRIPDDFVPVRYAQ
jgi:hypothetical protein